MESIKHDAFLQDQYRKLLLLEKDLDDQERRLNELRANVAEEPMEVVRILVSADLDNSEKELAHTRVKVSQMKDKCMTNV